MSKKSKRVTRYMVGAGGADSNSDRRDAGSLAAAKQVARNRLSEGSALKMSLIVQDGDVITDKYEMDAGESSWRRVA